MCIRDRLRSVVVRAFALRARQTLNYRAMHFETNPPGSRQPGFSIPYSLFPAFKHRPQRREQGFCQDCGAFGGGMNAVGLDAAGDWNQVFVNHGHKGDVVVSGEGAEKLLEGLDIVCLLYTSRCV